MKSKRKIITSILVLLITGCARLPLISQMVSQPTQVAERDVLFIDDFSETKSGWDRFQGEIGTTDYVKETYQITINEANTDLFANPSLYFSDVIIEVSASKLEGNEANNFGIICRYQDENNFYAGMISSDGYAGIFRIQNGKYQQLGHKEMQPMPAILGGSGKNLIHLECIGESIALAVNGIPVDARQDKTFKEGDVGLIAGTFDQPGVRIAFDDFKVMRP